MRKRTLRTLVAALGGALLGGLVVFLLLVNLGKRAETTASPPPVPVGKFAAASPSVVTAEPSPAPSADPRLIAVAALGVSLRIPDGYRVAATLNAFDDAQPGPKRYTITKATTEQEEQYVALVKELRARQSATEAPEFVPGGTITLAEAEAALGPEEQLAKTKTPVTTQRGLKGTRYALVEGLFTYDVTRLVRSEKRVTVSMSYGSAEPRFDEAAYLSVLESMGWL